MLDKINYFHSTRNIPKGKAHFRYSKIEILCKNCQKPILISPSRLGTRKYCSSKCAAILIAIEKKNKGNSIPKELNHRQIVEMHINRPLAKNEVVHHINGIHKDNRIENLVIMDRVVHLTMHSNYIKHPAPYEKYPHIKIC